MDAIEPYIIGLGAAWVAAALVTPVVVRFATRHQLLDRNGGRHIHARPVPRLGGPAIFAAMAVGLLAARGFEALSPTVGSAHRDFFMGIILGGAIIFVGGLVDDLKPLRPRWKVIWQVAAALVVFAFGFRIEALSVGQGSVAVGWLSLPLTLFWIVGVTNAYNLIDGLDGLATGIALVALGSVAVAAALLGHGHVVLAAAVLVGALIGLLRYNLHPARIFLGDSGSLFVGFMLAVLSVAGSLKSSTAIIAVVPLFALALPLLDTTLAIGRRWLRGVPVSDGDAQHIHHRLLAAGLSKRRVIQVLYLGATFFAAVGLLVAFAPAGRVTLLAVSASAVSAFLVLRGLRQLQYEEFAVAGKVLASGPTRARRVIRDRLYAQDIAVILRTATAIEDVQTLLSEKAETFGFAHMELCRESDHTRVRLDAGDSARHWKLDFPVIGPEHDPLVLRIWCQGGDGFRPYGAERVAAVLAPALASSTILHRTEPEHGAAALQRIMPPVGSAAAHANGKRGGGGIGRAPRAAALHATPPGE